MENEKTNNIIYFNIFATILVILALIVNFIIIKNETEHVDEDITDPIIVELCVWQYINDCGIEHPHIVYAQAKLESGNFSSRLAVEDFNYFGMQVPAQRPHLGVANGRYLKFEDWKHSVHDYLIWQMIYAKGLTEDEYFDYLGRVYAKDKYYVKKLKYILNK